MAGPEQHPHRIPNAALDAFDLGSREYVLGNNDKALEHFDKAVELHDDFSDAFYMRGLALFRAGRDEEAIDSLQKAADTTGNAILKDYALNRIAKEQGNDRDRFRKRLIKDDEGIEEPGPSPDDDVWKRPESLESPGGEDDGAAAEDA